MRLPIAKFSHKSELVAAKDARKKLRIKSSPRIAISAFKGQVGATSGGAGGAGANGVSTLGAAGGAGAGFSVTLVLVLSAGVGSVVMMKGYPEVGLRRL